MSSITRLDRTIVTIFPPDGSDPDDTPSRRDEISVAEERLQRLHGVILIQSACCILIKAPSCYPTAAVIFHRFFHQVSLRQVDVWSVAMAATLLAFKIEDVALPIRKLILAFVHLYRRQTLLLLLNDDDDNANSVVLLDQQQILGHPQLAVCPLAKSLLSTNQKLKHLREKIPALSPMGAIYKEWHDAVLQTESHILRQLGFTLHWIPDQHPHKYIPHLVSALRLNNEALEVQLSQTAWKYCNCSCQLDLCVRFSPSKIACAAMYLVLLDHHGEYRFSPHINWQLLLDNGADDNNNNANHLSVIANAILGLCDEKNVDMVIASKGFVKSHNAKPSFNDPGSFLWEMLLGR
jgi:hypothetical protein